MVQNQTSENCLYLNVWSPQVSKTADLPVIVFIPGGGFQEGSGGIAVYDGENLASTGLVVITINYRLGVLGFLAHPDLTAESKHHSSGNYGLMDQIAALRWVKANIQAFGGDPNRVTIWGSSAGAFSARDLIASPAAKGMFERVVADSGIGITEDPMPSLRTAEQLGVEFATLHNAHSLRELRALPASALLPGPNGPPLRFSPDIDGWILPQTPNAMSDNGEDKDVPVITGWQADDGRTLSRPIRSVAEFQQLAHHLYGGMADEFELLYPAQNVEEMQTAVNESTRDRERVSMFLWAIRRGRNHKSPVFTYYFDRAIPWPQHPEFGAFHAGELPYFFKNLKTLDRPFGAVDFNVSETASAYLKEFAAKGDPNGAALPKWPACNPSVSVTMEIGARIRPMPIAEKYKLNFWIRYFNSPESKNAPIF
jgi:para-nitrobenzyl esterase